MPYERSAQLRLDADAKLGGPRLRQFVGAMLPIAAAYLAMFVAGAIAWKNLSLAVGSVGIVAYLVALVAARSAIAQGRLARAALLTGSGLLAMIAIAVFAVHFQYPAFPLISIAAVVVVMPHVDRRSLVVFAGVALAVTAVVVAVGTMRPWIEQPPAWFRIFVTVSSVFAAASLIIVMLASDHQRMRGLVSESADYAEVAQRARAATDAFLVAASHQFRTPVSTLLLQSENLLRMQTTDEATRRRLERLVRSAGRLRLLVDAMLDVSRITSGTLHLDRSAVDVASLVRDVVTAQAAFASDAGVELIIEAAEMAEVEADARRLELVASQLIDNAVRLGPGRPARIEVRPDGEQIVLAVTDGGAQLPSTIREAVFERETSRSTSTDRDGGPGVGLWLVRELSRAMGGEVAARPGTERGTRFEVRLPRRVA